MPPVPASLPVSLSPASVWRHLRRWGSRFAEESPLVVASGLSLLCLPLIVALTWVVSERWQNERIDAHIQRQSQLMARQLNDIEIDIERTFSHVKNVTTWVARDEQVVRALLNPDRATQINPQLREMSQTFAVDLIYIMNTRGISVAASNAGTDASTIGRDYSDREHFQKAMQGMPGRQFAVGRTTRIPGFFFSMPIRQGKQIIGTVGVKLDQPNLQQQAHVPNGLLVDKNGVVVMADNPLHMFSSMPGVDMEKLPLSLRQSRYVRTRFAPLSLRSAQFERYPSLMLLDDKLVLLGKRELSNDNLTLYLLADMDAVSDAQRQGRFALIGGSIMGWLLAWGMFATLIVYARARDYRRQLELANTQLSQLNDELHEQASHDYLTGCLNRRALSERLTGELERVRRYGGELTLAILDIDYFKQINDGYGHAVGDQALQFLVKTLTVQLRRTDVLARIGGEEFAVLMPGTSLDVGMQVIDRMRASLAHLQVGDVTPPLHLSFSAGVAAWRAGLSERALLQAADHALYAAKQQGRNRVLSGG